MEHIKAILFDMDGVIVDSEPIHDKAMKQTCLDFGIELHSKEMDGFRGRKLEDIISSIIHAYGKDERLAEAMTARKVELYLLYALKEMELTTGVYEFLINLRKNLRYQCAVVTSGRRISQEKILRKFDLLDFFEIIVTAEDVHFGKPHPEPYMITADKLKEKPENCLVVEDAENGILSAKAAGCVACGITTTFDAERLKKAGADVVVGSFGELGKILNI